MIRKLITLSLTVFLSVALMVTLLTSAVTASNLISNPSVEINSGGLPTSWGNSKTGTNTTTFSYLNTGHTGSHSLNIDMTKRTSGNARWYFTPVNVLPNTTYTFSDWYQSNMTTYALPVVTTTNGGSTNLTRTTVASSATWKQFTVNIKTPANAKTMTIYHMVNAVGQLTTDDYGLDAVAAVAPTVQITLPVNGANVSGTQTVTATASGGSQSVKNVQFKLDGINLGSADTTAPYSISWNTKNSTNGSHTLSAMVTNTANATAASANVVVNVNNPTAPSVQITSPINGATISGSQIVTANATDAQGISNVQFKLDGANLGSADTTAPYSVTWDTTGVANGNHTLTAVATNTSNLSTTSTSVAINVNNFVPPPVTNNLIPNPSVETSANGTSPDSWLSSNWGTNTAVFSYLSTGHTGNRSVKAEITSYTNGAANWYYADVPATVGKTYKYENWYQSNVDTEVDAQVVMNDGTIQYYWLGTVFASTNWAKYSGTFTVPVGAKSIALYQILAKPGYIVSDDYLLAEYTPTPFNHGLVSVTFDDGWSNQYTNGFPLLNKYGLKATFYIISGELNDQPDYMSITQIKNLQNAGNEIASHSVSHPDLTTLSQANLISEMSQSQITLQNTFGVPVVNFAYPFGAYNANTIAVGKQYYRSQRSVNQGLNTKDNFDITTLKIYEVDSNISQAQVQGWIQTAIAQNAWLILVYHEIAITPIDPSNELYTTQPADLDAELGYLKSTGVSVVTVQQALNELLPQL